MNQLITKTKSKKKIRITVDLSEADHKLLQSLMGFMEFTSRAAVIRSVIRRESFLQAKWQREGFEFNKIALIKDGKPTEVMRLFY